MKEQEDNGWIARAEEGVEESETKRNEIETKQEDKLIRKQERDEEILKEMQATYGNARLSISSTEGEQLEKMTQNYNTTLGKATGTLADLQARDHICDHDHNAWNRGSCISKMNNKYIRIDTNANPPEVVDTGNTRTHRN